MESPLDGEREILLDRRTPKKGDKHPDFKHLEVVSVQIQQDDDCPIKWDVTVEYGLPAGESEDDVKQFDPTGADLLQLFRADADHGRGQSRQAAP